jgi:hypothetical protein
MLRRALLGVGAATLALSMSATIALAGNPSGTGQPTVSCSTVSASPNGFLKPGFAVAASVYANVIPPSTGFVASNNTHVVAQYDVACIQLSRPRP